MLGGRYGRTADVRAARVSLALVDHRSVGFGDWARERPKVPMGIGAPPEIHSSAQSRSLRRQPTGGVMKTVALWLAGLAVIILPAASVGAFEYLPEALTMGALAFVWTAFFAGEAWSERKITRREIDAAHSKVRWPPT